MGFKKAFGAFIDLIFPPRCVFCGAVVPGGLPVCKACEGHIPYARAIKYMNIPDTGKTIICTVPYSYSGQVRESIIRFKFQNQKQFASFFAEKVAEQIRIGYPDIRFDMVTCVPISAKRRKTRGYNQSELIAADAALRLGLPYRECLAKVSDNREQHKLSEKERRRNVRGVYRQLCAEETAGKRVLLIDDIVTTGATLCECASVLYRNGAEEVACAAIAQVE
ncbi:MAG TPA: ComF family protein [Caproiciproducens sp.]|nr:ComF family protein [Caproiciproducens sp.]